MKKIKMNSLKLNDRNPRTITEDRFADLVRSIKDFPAMMELRPIVVDKDGVVLGGNMRFRACQHLGMTEIPASWVKRADTLTAEERRRFVVMDNAGFGEWDMDVLGADYELPELAEWGLELPGGMDVPDHNKSVDEEAMKETEHECPKCGFKW